MKILIEGENYSIEKLKDLFEDQRFYIPRDLEGQISSVGYYYSFEKKTLILMLPKVFMKDGNLTVFSNKTKDEIFELNEGLGVKHSPDSIWLRQLSFYFYHSLLIYRRRNENSTLVNSSETFEVNTNIGNEEYSYLDLLLSFLRFYKKNKDQVLYLHIDYLSKQARKVKWEKTIRKSLPIIQKNKVPIYMETFNKKKKRDTEEELITIFFSIMYHLNKEHKLNISIDNSYKIIKGKAFQCFLDNGLKKIRKIRYKYFNDTLRRMYHLCELYLTYTNNSSKKGKREEYLAVQNYNLIFEDMVDKLFSDNLENGIGNENSLKDLKNNKDGKIIDHLYKYKSIFDSSSIFYIGDSKYYKSDSNAGTLSKYKQFTYAKNVIQFNINLLNKTSESYPGTRYRDSLTEGYNISPNFFIYGFIEDPKDYDYPLIKEWGSPVVSCHWKGRLFDRDTLFVHQYKINFLYVLKAYSSLGSFQIETFRKQVQKTFRKKFLSYLNDPKKSKFEFFRCTLGEKEKKDFVEENFKVLNGKCYRTMNGQLILAKNIEDSKENAIPENIMENFIPIKDLTTL